MQTTQLGCWNSQVGSAALGQEMSNANKVVLVTGASSGIGKACVVHLAKCGYWTFGTSRLLPSKVINVFPSKLVQQDSLNVVQMDVDDDVSVTRAVKQVITKASRLDVVVNNAGFGIAGAIEDTSIEEAKALFETNFFGVLRVCNTVLPIMRKQGAGTIVNISSLAGRIALPFQGVYSASKFGIEGLTAALRMEVRPLGIHVVLIEPGDFHTNFTDNRRLTAASQKNEAYMMRSQKALDVVRSDEAKGCPPELVARLLQRILLNPSPRLRYSVGALSQRLPATLRNFVPPRFFERGVMQHYDVL